MLQKQDKHLMPNGALNIDSIINDAYEQAVQFIDEDSYVSFFILFYALVLLGSKDVPYSKMFRPSFEVHVRTEEDEVQFFVCNEQSIQELYSTSMINSIENFWNTVRKVSKNL